MQFDKLVDQILAEKKAWYDQPVLNKLQPYSNDPYYFVTFTDIEKVGINPSNKFSTPIGVYAYSLKHLWNDWVHGDDFFGKDRPYVNLLKLITDKVLNLNSYKLNNKDLSTLKSLVPNKEAFNNILQTSKQEITNNKNLYQNYTDGALLWHLTERVAKLLASNDGKAFTVRWNKIFRVLGYDVVYDEGSIIHVLQSSQCVFFTPDSYELIERYNNKQQLIPVTSEWGSSQQPFWRPGMNPTVDMVLKYIDNNDIKVLLIQRNSKSGTEAGKWAIPGGFIDTNAGKGEPFEWGRETPKQAAIRELAEETRLYLGNISDIGGRIKPVGEFEGNNRDPRDNEQAWSKSYAFTITLGPNDRIDLNRVRGQDDAQDAQWFSIKKLPPLAFDHSEIINKALQIQ